MKIHTLALTALTIMLISTTTQASSIQGILGAVRYDNLEIDDGSGNAKTIDVSTMPQFGAVWSTTPKGERIQFGIEGSLLAGFNYESATYDPTVGPRVRVDYNIWMFDLTGGLYANLFMGKNDKVRIYAAGGPLIMSSVLHSYTFVDSVNDSYYFNRESAFGYGLYARAGFEFRLHESGMIGLGVRGTWAELDLSNTSDLTSIAAFATYTFKF